MDAEARAGVVVVYSHNRAVYIIITLAEVV